MKNRVLIISLLCLLILTGCSSPTYSFKKSLKEIESIEIVYAESSLQFTIIKKLSEMEKNNFLEGFQKIKFNNYYMGDPMSVYGNSVKVTYQNGDYEMICYNWAEYVKNGETYFIRKNCNEKEFNDLLNNFLE